MTEGTPTCPCGGTDFESGRIVDAYQTRQSIRWRPAEDDDKMFFRGAHDRDPVALRCTSCGRLELFAP